MYDNIIILCKILKKNFGNKNFANYGTIHRSSILASSLWLPDTATTTTQCNDYSFYLFNEVCPSDLCQLEVGLALYPVEGLRQLQHYHGNGTGVPQLANLHLASVV